MYCEYDNGVIQGSVRFMDRTKTKLLAEAHYVDGNVHGLCWEYREARPAYYGPNSQISEMRIEQYYEHGVLMRGNHFNADSSKRCTYTCKNGLLHETVSLYTSTGVLQY